MFPQRNTRPSEPISAVKFTSAVRFTSAVKFTSPVRFTSAVRTFAMTFPQTFAVMFPQTFAMILTGRVKLHVCVVFKSFAVILVGHRQFVLYRLNLPTSPQTNFVQVISAFTPKKHVTFVPKSILLHYKNTRHPYSPDDFTVLSCLANSVELLIRENHLILMFSPLDYFPLSLY